MQCFQSFAIVLFGMLLLLPGQGASGKNLRRRENTTIDITIAGVLELTIFEYHQDFMRFCIRMNVTDKKIAFNGYYKEQRIDEYKEIVSAAVDKKIAFNGYSKEQMIDEHKEIVSAAERAISDNVSKFLKNQCLNSTGKAIRRDDVSEPIHNTRILSEGLERRRIQLLARNYASPWTESFNVTIIGVHIDGQSAFKRNSENVCFKFDQRTPSITADYVVNNEDTNIKKLQEGKELALVYIEGITNDVDNYFMHYKHCKKLNTDQILEKTKTDQKPEQPVKESDPANNTTFLEEVNTVYTMLSFSKTTNNDRKAAMHYKHFKKLNTDQLLILEKTKTDQKPEQPAKKSDPANNTTFLEEVNRILENRHETPEKTLHKLDQLSLAWAVEDRPVKLVKDDVAVLVPYKLVRGLRVSSTAGRSEFEKYSFDFLDEAPSPRILRSQETEVAVTLPPSALMQSHVSFIVFQNESLFPSQPNGFIVNSLVVSVNIKNVTHFHGGEVIDIHFRPIATPRWNESRSCAYWHFLENSTGYWSQEGCDFVRATEDGMLDTCRCNHLTHFAEILVAKAVFSEANESALEILTIAGCSLSIIGLIIVGATAILFRSWRQEFRNKIWLQMCMAILILVVTFLVVIFAHYDRYHVKCLLLGVTLHYAVLASFCWMLVAAVLAYRQLALVFARDVPHKLLRAAVFAWGAPGVVCGVLLSVSPESYARRFQEMTPGGNFCYPSGLSLWLAVYAPISVILVTNWTLLALILRSVFCTKKIQRYGESAEALRSVSVSCKLGFLFGLPWVFGLFASNVVAAYLFTLTATFQGFVSFALLVTGSKQTRDLWANKMFKKRNIMPMRLVSDNDCSADAAVRNNFMVKVMPNSTHF